MDACGRLAHRVAVVVLGTGIVAWTPGHAAMRSTPFESPQADDHTFVADTAQPGALDADCSTNEEGPLLIGIPVDRFVGPTNPDSGGLLHAESLVQAGLLSRYATLTIAFRQELFNHDPNAFPHRDLVSFNGRRINLLSSTNPAYLHDGNEIGVTNTFRIPIETIRFPATRGNPATGIRPAAAMNELRIDIDTANVNQELDAWCTEIDWASLTFHVISPVILIHGNDSNGGFYERQGFTTTLDAAGIAWDNSVLLPADRIRNNAARLDGFIPGIVASFGVDSVHLVVHSKGGLDSRGYLARYQPAHDDAFRVLSVSSLSTPHDGSVLADALVARAAASREAVSTVFSGFPAAIGILAGLQSLDDGRRDLTTDVAARFGATNLARLPAQISYHTVAADADRDDNGRIDAIPDEFAALRTESPGLTRLYSVNSSLAAGAVNALYQTLRGTSTVAIRYVDTSRGRLAVVQSVPSATPHGNDTLVTLDSGHGAGGFSARTTHAATFEGWNARNHSNVADEGVATTITPWIVEAERAREDL